jgi:hypothetical protein
MAVETLPMDSTGAWLTQLQLLTLQRPLRSIAGGFVDSREWIWTRITGIGLGVRAQLPNQHLYHIHPVHVEPMFYALYRKRASGPTTHMDQCVVQLPLQYPSLLDFMRDLVHRIQREEAELGH